MAKIPENVIYRFYGCGIPKQRAIKFVTMHNIKASAPYMEKGRLIVNICAQKQRHTGVLLLKFAEWLFGFCGIRVRINLSRDCIY